MELRVGPRGPLKGRLKVPGDKSISHRAAILGAIADGPTEIHNFLEGEDCLHTLACLERLGVVIEGPRAGRVTLHGRGLHGLQEPADILDAGNSGTTIRLFCGLLAGQPFYATITGDASIRRRPMARVTRPLREMGARIFGREDASLAPITVMGGKLRGIDHELPVASAQVKSALLLAGLYAEGRTSVREPHRSRDHTERMLPYFGAPLEVEGTSVAITPPPRLAGQRIRVPGDFSSAAFFLVAATIVPGSELLIEGVGVNPTRTGLLEALELMGADLRLFNLREEGGEPMADLLVRHAPLHGISLGGEMIPRLIDEVPVLAVAACLAEGETSITDCQELAVKETNRLRAIVEELGRLGARVEEIPGGLVVRGPVSLEGACVDSRGDHRMAMALAVAGLVARGETVIRGAESVSISFPGFLEAWEAIFT